MSELREFPVSGLSCSPGDVGCVRAYHDGRADARATGSCAASSAVSGLPRRFTAAFFLLEPPSSRSRGTATLWGPKLCRQTRIPLWRPGPEHLEQYSNSKWRERLMFEPFHLFQSRSQADRISAPERRCAWGAIGFGPAIIEPRGRLTQP